MNERGKGRDDYPLWAMWNALLAGIVFQHESDARLLRELSRNGELQAMCAFHGKSPHPVGFQPFSEKILAHQADVEALFDQLVKQAGKAQREEKEKRHAEALKKSGICSKNDVPPNNLGSPVRNRPPAPLPTDKDIPFRRSDDLYAH